MNSSPTADLHLRQAGNTSSSILTTIPKGSALSVTGAAVNGWFPVTYGGKTGWVKGTYLNPMSAPTPTTPTTGPPPTAPTAPVKTEANQSNPFYDPTSNYGASQNAYNTPLVKGAANFDQEWTKFITEQGFGGNNQKGNFALNLADKAKAGLASAQMSNPSLIPRDYLNNTLGGNFLANARAAATPLQRGEQRGLMAPVSRWTPR